MMKNCEPFVLGPALAMERSIGFSCFNVNDSSEIQISSLAFGRYWKSELTCLQTMVRR